MKVKDIPILKQKVLDAIPITQAEIAKILGIDRRDTSRLIVAMLKDHIIKRTKTDNTFLVEKNGSDVSKKEKDFGALLSGDKFSPCCGCELECDPGHCQKLTEWLMQGINIEEDNKKDKKNDKKSGNKKDDKKFEE